MAAEFAATKLNADSHLFLDQPLLRLPHELARRNFKTCQRYVEREKEYLLPAIKETANASLSSNTPDQTIASLDAMINRMQNFKRKLQTLQEEEQTIQEHSKKRIQHLQELYEIPSLADVKYDQWSRKRLDRLLVDYLLRNGYGKSAELLSQRKDITDLVDLEVFAQCQKIADSLEKGETKDALAWCAENRTALKKLGQNDLEFELRLQQYIEMLRRASKTEALSHARKYLATNFSTNEEAVKKATGLLAFGPDTYVEPYKTLYSRNRWTHLSHLFTQTHHKLLGLPSRPLIHVALSAGLSALKTPSCHSSYTSSSSNASSTITTVCPICSIELKELAVHVPYAHHTKSHVENDPIVLPNGRIYGKHKLEEMQKKMALAMGLDPSDIRDPTTGEVFHWWEVKKVYIT
ncbi:putative macrophage erythroblast attacher [Phaeomoniella chlamydospora]|uniref:Protein FYV10 n=1 Tax=Phaeomoniella chlamydospora TaxID=158046 RepID=A0A0G2ETC7_PHACM|nr:putative macrophage erythroblast attacher [Phaeomoniella chlamydospora]